VTIPLRLSRKKEEPDAAYSSDRDLRLPLYPPVSLLRR
jgi:hypothetical protein